MKKNVISKILAGALAATMVLGMAACGDNTDPGTSGSGSGAGAGNESGSGQASGNSGSGNESGSDQQQEEKLPPMKLNISCVSFTTEHEEPNPTYDKLVASLNEYLNADINWEWQTQADGYYGRLGLRYAAGDVADVMVVGFDAAFFSAATGGSYETLAYDDNGDPVMQDVLDEEGNPVKDDDGNVKQEQAKVQASVTDPIFWDLTDYLDDYDNLAEIPASAREECSYMGRLYGIPRVRAGAGRNGFGYRKDWLEKLNLKEPETWDDFKEMLRAFTEDDPDENGVRDTVGLGLDSWTGVYNIMMAWFNVPNMWGVDANGDLIHRSQTPEYLAALKAFRELFELGYVNDGSQVAAGIPKWEDVGAGNAKTELLNTGKAGVLVQVVDDCRKVETYFEDNGLYGAVAGTEDEDELIFTLQSYVLTDSGNNEPHILPTGGNNGGIAISKTGNVKTEEDLRRVLQILNDMNDGECITMIESGWEGVTYEIDEDGYLSSWLSSTEEDEAEKRAKLDAAGVGSVDFNNGFNQILAYVTAEANAKTVEGAPISSAIRRLEDRLRNGSENIPYMVLNKGAACTSKYYVDNAAALDKILDDAMMQFITGEIDETALQKALERWWTAGGEQVTKEMNEQYHANGN